MRETDETAGPTLLTGATGLLGPYLHDALSALGPVVTVGRRGADRTLDLTAAEDVRAAVAEIGPRRVVHAAGLTDVDACERDPGRARRVNATTTEALAAALPPGIPLVYLSTDQVYGATGAPHGEETVAPMNAYGASKLAGEGAARTRPDALVLRVNFFGPSRTAGRESLSDFVVGRLVCRERLPLFVDSFFSPLHMATLADIVQAGVARGLTGVFNVGSRAGLSKRDFGLAIARHLDLPTDNAVDVRSADIEGRAPRPPDLRMDVGRIEAAQGRPMPTLAEEIAKL